MGFDFTGPRNPSRSREITISFGKMKQIRKSATHSESETRGSFKSGGRCILNRAEIATVKEVQSKILILKNYCTQQSVPSM